MNCYFILQWDFVSVPALFPTVCSIYPQGYHIIPLSQWVQNRSHLFSNTCFDMIPYLYRAYCNPSSFTKDSMSLCLPTSYSNLLENWWSKHLVSLPKYVLNLSSTNFGQVIIIFHLKFDIAFWWTHLYQFCSFSIPHVIAQSEISLF